MHNFVGSDGGNEVTLFKERESEPDEIEVGWPVVLLASDGG
jgi:hypothetical protein